MWSQDSNMCFKKKGYDGFEPCILTKKNNHIFNIYDTSWAWGQTNALLIHGKHILFYYFGIFLFVSVAIFFVWFLI